MVKRYKITPTCRTAECATKEDFDSCGGYEYGFSIFDNQYGDYLYECTNDMKTVEWYKNHNYYIEL